MHQRLSKQKAQEFVIEFYENRIDPNSFIPDYSKEEFPDLVDQIDEAIKTVLSAWAGMKSTSLNDSVEGELSIILYREFAGFPANVLTDPDFWRYCSARMAKMIDARHPRSKKSTLNLPPFRLFGADSNSISRDCVPLRMFNRARLIKLGAEAVGDPDTESLAKVKAGDVWKSHILRVLNGNSPIMARELIIDTRDVPNFTSDKSVGSRPVVSSLKKVRSNVLFEVLDQHQTRNLIEAQKTRLTSGVDTKPVGSKGLE